jgi:drug/metabolite transporter (DMT)-like permease
VPPLRELVPVAVYGVLWLGVYSFTLSAAERRVDAGTAAMLINTGPILIAVLAGAVLDEGFPRRLFLGCAVALAGCVLIGLGQTGAETLASRCASSPHSRTRRRSSSRRWRSAG